MGLVYDRRRDLAAAEEWYRKAVARAPTAALYRNMLDVTVQRRAEDARMDEVAAARAKTATAAEAIELAERAHRFVDRRYVLAVRLYGRAFATDPALADNINARHRYSAAWCAVLAASGKDDQMTAFGVEAWGHLTGLALGWLRADLTRLSALAKDPRQRRGVREVLTYWKQDAGLVTVRDPGWLAAMPPGDRKEWESLRADVDALLAAVSPTVAPPPRAKK